MSALRSYWVRRLVVATPLDYLDWATLFRSTGFLARWIAVLLIVSKIILTCAVCPGFSRLMQPR